MNKKMFLSLVAGLFFSVTALILAFRNIPVKDLALYLGSVNYIWLVPTIVISLISFILRVFRWQWILKSHKKIPFANAYHPLMIGFMLNCILPGRIGELARPLILKKNEGIPFSTGLGSIVTERLFDMICLITLLACVLLFIDIDSSLSVKVGQYTLSADTLKSIAIGMVEFCIVLIAGIIAVSIRMFREFMASCLLKIPGMLFFINKDRQKRFEEKAIRPLIGLMDHFAQGLSLLQNPGKIVTCFVLSMTIWLVQAWSYHIMTFACPGLSIAYTETMAVMIIICFFIALPSVPGYWGLWEAGGVFGLTLFSVAAEQAAGYTLINHVVQIIPVIIAGIVSALIIGVNFKQLYRQTQDTV